MPRWSMPLKEPVSAKGILTSTKPEKKASANFKGGGGLDYRQYEEGCSITGSYIVGIA